MNGDALIGYTGFVGSNLAAEHRFYALYNSANIGEACGKYFDTLVYSGVRAEKFIANNNPEKDKEHIKGAIKNISEINFNKLVLISTIDVYPDTAGKYEDDEIASGSVQAYGSNRYMLEEWVRENVKNYHIIRLPALFGKGLKKNFIYDMINIIPQALKADKFIELKEKFKDIDKFYRDDGAFRKLKDISRAERKELKDFFMKNDFNALSFTDSRSKYQFYNLKNLWKDICIAIDNDIKTLNMAAEPVEAGELYRAIFGKPFVNILNNAPVSYDMRSRYCNIFSGKNGYLYDKDTAVSEIKDFIKSGGI